MNAIASPNLAQVLDHPGIWRRSADRQPRVRALSTGWTSLDAKLPGGGWPQGALSEILFEHDGLGELDLVMPALAALTQEHRRVIFVAPPYLPYAPALAAAGVDLRFLHEIHAGSTEAAWSMEQCLRSGCCGAVVGWLPDIDYRSLRRLQLAPAPCFSARPRMPRRTARPRSASRSATATRPPMWMSSSRAVC